MVAEDPQRCWDEFDRLVAGSPLDTPWEVHADGRLRFYPRFGLLQELLAVPLRLGVTTQSGLPAKAVDVWVAHELRRAGFLHDEVWPRTSNPRVLPREVGLLRDFPGMIKLSRELFNRIDAGKVGAGVTSSDAKILGKAYAKQVDVVIAQWSRGPELMISTKRMDSSFGKNALNRIEESYGDAKNLRGRFPLAATGFLFVLRSSAFTQERDTTLRLLDLLVKLAQEADGYDATGLIVVEWEDPSGTPVLEEIDEDEEHDISVEIRHDLIPPGLAPADFLSTMVTTVLDRTPIDLHEETRRRLGQAVPEGEG